MEEVIKNLNDFVLKTHRKHEWIADRAKISMQHLQDILDGKVTSLEDIRPVAELFGKEPSFFLGEFYKSPPTLEEMKAEQDERLARMAEERRILLENSPYLPRAEALFKVEAEIEMNISEIRSYAHNFKPEDDCYLDALVKLETLQLEMLSISSDLASKMREAYDESEQQ